jgi:hypothetical protein
VDNEPISWHPGFAEGLREVREMIMTQGLREALVDLGLAAEWERQGEARGEITGVGLAVDLFKKGYTPDEIEHMLANGSLPLDGKG